MNQVQIARQNHYVPIWYQRGFILGHRGTLQYLDLFPPSIDLPNGRTVSGKTIRFRPAKRCFRQKDLYTTQLGGTLNDEIEKFLFGLIDTRGANAVRAFLGGEPQMIHKYFLRIFEYLNAQKLRTPKGLDWIKGSYPSLTQLDLMREMQYLRQMHCTMWLECVREIASAKNSDVKFIVTDHPVTVYNSACQPTSSVSQYPGDPSIDLNGTQTVFPLDSDHCLILTNLEYAQDPTGVDLLAPRQNARYSGQTIARTDTMIRSRMLTPDEVVAINSLLKSRSRQYLAAYKDAWLFPENLGPVGWKDIGEVLLPPRDLISQFSGQMFIRNKDGSKYYQDAFGRTDRSHYILKKKAPSTAITASDLCACGSGRTYKECCIDLASDERPPWDVYSIRDRNLILCNAVVDILDLNDEADWEDVRRNLSNDQVKSIHEVFATLWPEDTKIADLLPLPDRRVFRGIYMGFVDPRTIALSVISSLAYFDEILILNPFPNPVHRTPTCSPTRSATSYKSQTLKNVSVLLTLQPFIDAGIVHLVPDPMEFDSTLDRTVTEMIEERTANWEPSQQERRLFEALAKDDFDRKMLRMPEHHLRSIVRRHQPHIDPEGIERTVSYMKRKLANDPLALLQPLPAGKEDGEVSELRGMPIELAMFIAHLTASAIYTDDPGDWRQLHEHTSAAAGVSQHSQWTLMAKTVANRTFPIEGNPLINLELRKAGKLDRTRGIFRQIWNAAVTNSGNVDMDDSVKQCVTNLEDASIRDSIEFEAWSTTTGPSSRFQRRIEFSAPDAGFNMNSVHRLLLTSGRTNHIGSVPIALYLTFESGQDWVFA